MPADAADRTGLLIRGNFRGLDARAVGFEVEAALGLGGAGPSAGAGVFADLDRTRAAERVAANARVALLVERVVGEVVLLHVAVNIALRPREQRADGEALVAAGPLDDLA